MGKSQIKSHTQISDLSREVFKSFSQTSNLHFSSNPKSFKSNLKSNISENVSVNRFLTEVDSDI